jgi:hypothetical protein
MSKLVSNTDGGKTDEYGTQLWHQRIFIGEVAEGCKVVANSSPDMGVRVQAGTLRIPTGSAPANYWYEGIIDTASPGEALTVPPANPSNPYKAYVIAFIDKANVTPTTSVTNNSNALLKLAIATGTPASSPNVPTSSQINSAKLNSTNPHIILGLIDVPANATQITNANITDLRSMVSLTNAVKFADLLSTIFSDQVTSYTNGGTAGGTFKYLNLGGIKLLWGKTAAKAVGIGGAGWTILFPASFFSSIQSVLLTVGAVTIDNKQYVDYTNGALSTSQITITQVSATNGSTQETNVFIIGT